LRALWRPNSAEQRYCGSCGASLGGLVDSKTIAAPAAIAAAGRSAALPEWIGGRRYRILRLLGEGGSKIVYLGHDRKLDRDVAISTFRIEGLDQAGRERVAREARAMGRLEDHPHIVLVYDFGEENELPYLVSQYMAGGTLDHLLRRSPEHRLPRQEALRIVDQVCQALEYVHGKGIIHRDIKPANIFLSHDGKAKLGDFGLAIAPDQSRLTIRGMVVGTLAYMPPEQALGRKLEPRSDLYSLGAMFYELLTGRTPFLADDINAMISQHLVAPPEPPSARDADIPREVDRLVLQLLAKNPVERPASATAIREMIRAIGDAASIAPAAPLPVESVAPAKSDARELPESLAGVAEGDTSAESKQPPPSIDAVQLEAERPGSSSASSAPVEPAPVNVVSPASASAMAPEARLAHQPVEEASPISSPAPDEPPSVPERIADAGRAPEIDLGASEFSASASPEREEQISAAEPPSSIPLDSSPPQPIEVAISPVPMAPVTLEPPPEIAPARFEAAPPDTNEMKPTSAVAADTASTPQADTAEFAGPSHTKSYATDWLVEFGRGPIRLAAAAAVGLLAIVFGAMRFGPDVLDRLQSKSAPTVSTAPATVASPASPQSASSVEARAVPQVQFAKEKSARKPAPVATSVHVVLAPASATPALIARAHTLTAPSSSAGTALSAPTAKPGAALNTAKPPATRAPPPAAAASTGAVSNPAAIAPPPAMPAAPPATQLAMLTKPAPQPPSERLQPPLVGMGAIDRINHFRKMAGLPIVAESVPVTVSDAERASALWRDHQSSAGVASAQASAPSGFRLEVGGVEPSYGDWRTNLVASDAPAQWGGGDAIDSMMRTPTGSLAVLDPQTRELGFSMKCSEGVCAAVMSSQRGLPMDAWLGLYELSAAARFRNPNLGAYGPAWGNLLKPIAFPPNGSSIALSSYPGGEAADILGACPDYSVPTGIPISLQLGSDSEAATQLVVGKHSLTRNGVPVEHCVVSASSFDADSGGKIAQRWSRQLRVQGAIVVIPREPLLQSSTYSVSISANSTDYSWSFKTRGEN
jgi:serine/threonine protein kinase